MIPKKPKKRAKNPSRCREKCLKKYLKPGLEEYQGETYWEKFDSCLSAHYVCCKPDPDNDLTEHKDAIEQCRVRVSGNMQSGEGSDE